MKIFTRFELAQNKTDFDFKQNFQHPFGSLGGKTFQNDRDPDLNYFDELTIQNKETTFIMKLILKKRWCENQRFENSSVRRLKNQV